MTYPMDTELQGLFGEISRRIEMCEWPCGLILEFGHISVKGELEEMEWAARNVIYAEHLCSLLIRRFHRNLRIVAFIILNDMAQRSRSTIPEELLTILQENRFLKPQRINILSERNLKNVATKRLKEIVRDPQAAGRVFEDLDRLMLQDMPDNMSEDCPAVGNINLRDGHLVPRCSSILAAFVERAVRRAHERLQGSGGSEMILLSFARTESEFRQTALGIHLYLHGWPGVEEQMAKTNQLTGIVVHWKPSTGSQMAMVDVSGMIQFEEKPVG